MAKKKPANAIQVMAAEIKKTWRQKKALYDANREKKFEDARKFYNNKNLAGWPHHGYPKDKVDR
jgi:hypothetical protein